MNGTSERATNLRGLPRSNRACPPVYTRGGRSGAPSRSLFPALYRTRMPCSVIRAGGTVLGPVDEVPGRRDGESGDAAVPLRVREDVGTVLRLDDTGVLHSAGPFVRPLRVRVGIEHGHAAAREL